MANFFVHSILSGVSNQFFMRVDLRGPFLMKEKKIRELLYRNHVKTPGLLLKYLKKYALNCQGLNR